MWVSGPLGERRVTKRRKEWDQLLTSAIPAASASVVAREAQTHFLSIFFIF